MTTTNPRIKQSFIAGALTSTAGVFISKALGLLYVAPLTRMAGVSNFAYYSSAYTYYDLLLQLCTAGLPFAIAALVSKYANSNDYKTVLLVRKLSTSILMISGFVMAIIFVLISGPLASSSLGSSASASDVQTMQTVFMILAVAIAIVPFLSSIRGFYQGLKEMQTYALSQVIEQLTRVLSLLALGAFCVYILKMERIWAIYMAVAATSLAALAAIAYYMWFDHRYIGKINREARAQEAPAHQPGDLVKELFAFGLPYIIASVLGNSMNIINTNYFIATMTNAGYDYELSKTLYSLIQVQANKLTSIPQVLAIGFSAGIVPYMTSSLENKDYALLQKNIQDCLDTVLYIGLPVCLCLLSLAGPIYYVMYGVDSLEYGTAVLKWSSILGVTGMISPICTSMMMTLRLRKRSLIYLAIGFAVKTISFFPLINNFGYSGAITSTALASIVIIFLNLQAISNKYHVNYRRTLKRLFKICICLIAMNGMFVILRFIGLDPTSVNTLLAILELAIYGIAGFAVYLYTSSILKLPQSIFGQSILDILKKIFKKGKSDAQA